MDCKQCTTEFEITDADRQLYDKVSPIINGQKYSIPDPIYCPDCRLQRHTIFRNEYMMYRRTSSLSDKPIISIYSPDKPDVIYSYDEWWSDDWDPLDYGRDFDFNRPFFEQFQELFLAVPKLNLIQDGTSENCEYTNYGHQNKNCYLTMGFQCEDVYYSDAFFCRNCTDCLLVGSSEKIYECIDCDQCYNSAYLQNCGQCSNSWFLESCNGCKNCLGCKNLQNKEYYIFNKSYSAKEYEKIFKNYNLDTYTGIKEFKKKFNEFKLTLPFRFSQQKLCEDSTGDFLDGAKNCHHCFKVVAGAENCRYSVAIGLNCHDIIDCNNAEGSLHYDADGILNSQHVLLSHFARSCSEIIYGIFCYNSQNLFGCTGLNRKQYCILNKQYSKGEYEELVPKIIDHMRATGEWGQFFPPSISSFCYNESYANDIFPLTKEEAIQKGFKWSDYEPKIEAERTIPASRLPDNIKDVPDDVLSWAIECEITKKPFKIIAQELKFYREHNLPLPRRHHNQRHQDRTQQKNPYKLWPHKCDKCGVDIQTSFAPERPEIVYCEKCYLAEVY